MVVKKNNKNGSNNKMDDGIKSCLRITNQGYKNYCNSYIKGSLFICIKEVKSFNLSR